MLASIDKLPTRYMTTSSAEIAEAQRMDGHARDLTIAHLKAPGFSSGTKISALFETTYFAGLRKAGMPEE